MLGAKSLLITNNHNYVRVKINVDSFLTKSITRKLAHPLFTPHDPQIYADSRKSPEMYFAIGIF